MPGQQIGRDLVDAPGRHVDDFLGRIRERR